MKFWWSLTRCSIHKLSFDQISKLYKMYLRKCHIQQIHVLVFDNKLYLMNDLWLNVMRPNFLHLACLSFFFFFLCGVYGSTRNWEESAERKPTITCMETLHTVYFSQNPFCTLKKACISFFFVFLRGMVTLAITATLLKKLSVPLSTGIYSRSKKNWLPAICEQKSI